MKIIGPIKKVRTSLKTKKSLLEVIIDRTTVFFSVETDYYVTNDDDFKMKI